VKLQVVFTGVTFNPSATVVDNSSPLIAATATAGLGAQTGSGAGGVSPPQAAQTSAEAPTGSKANTGTVAGGTVGGVAGVALVGALAFYLLRRRNNRSNQRRRIGSAFFE
jgi:LPXTG-motif cell wall-anchored protein